MSTPLQPKILVDTDVISHFIKGERLGLLHDVFPGRLAILDTVLTEVDRRPDISQQLAVFMKIYQVEEVTFPLQDEAVMLEYAALLRRYGKGESACMAVARHRGNYIASSNLRDIKHYCEEHGIQYYTTMEILHLAVQGNHLSEQECDEFIRLVKSRGSRLIKGCETYQDYIQRYR